MVLFLFLVGEKPRHKTHIHIHTHREREREKEKKREGGGEGGREKEGARRLGYSSVRLVGVEGKTTQLGMRGCAFPPPKKREKEREKEK